MDTKTRKAKRSGAQTDLTVGSIWKTVLKFSLPILFSYLLQTLYSVADAAICGYTLSGNEVAGVNDTGSISFLFLQFAFGCTSGMSVVIAECVGRRDQDAVRKAFAAQIVLGAIISAVLTVAAIFSIKPLLGVLGVTNSGNDTAREVYRAAYTYIAVICGGLVTQLFYNIICCVLRSIGDSLTPLLFLLGSSVLNVALDLLLIIVCKMGVAGAAAATVISQGLAAVGCFIAAFVRYPQLRLHAADFKGITRRLTGRTLWQGLPLGLQFSVLAIGIIVMSNGVIAFDKMPDGGMAEGTPAQLGYSAACKVDNILFMPFNALGTAMLSFCGQNHGAGNHDRIKKGTSQLLCIVLILSAVCGGIGTLLTINGAYQHLFLASDKITAQSVRFGNLYLHIVQPAFFFLGALLVLRNAVQGLAKPLFPFLAGVAELVARVVVCLVLPRLLNGGAITSAASITAFAGLSLADPLAWVAADIPLLIAAILYIYKKPKQKAPTEVDAAP